MASFQAYLPSGRTLRVFVTILVSAGLFTSSKADVSLRECVDECLYLERGKNNSVTCTDFDTDKPVTWDITASFRKSIFLGQCFNDTCSSKVFVFSIALNEEGSASELAIDLQYNNGSLDLTEVIVYCLGETSGVAACIVQHSPCPNTTTQSTATQPPTQGITTSIEQTTISTSLYAVPSTGDNYSTTETTAAVTEERVVSTTGDNNGTTETTLEGVVSAETAGFRGEAGGEIYAIAIAGSVAVLLIVVVIVVSVLAYHQRHKHVLVFKRRQKPKAIRVTPTAPKFHENSDIDNGNPEADDHDSLPDSLPDAVDNDTSVAQLTTISSDYLEDQTITLKISDRNDVNENSIQIHQSANAPGTDDVDGNDVKDDETTRRPGKTNGINEDAEGQITKFPGEHAADRNHIENDEKRWRLEKTRGANTDFEDQTIIISVSHDVNKNDVQDDETTKKTREGNLNHFDDQLPDTEMQGTVAGRHDLDGIHKSDDEPKCGSGKLHGNVGVVGQSEVNLEDSFDGIFNKGLQFTSSTPPWNDKGAALKVWSTKDGELAANQGTELENQRASGRELNGDESSPTGNQSAGNQGTELSQRAQLEDQRGTEGGPKVTKEKHIYAKVQIDGPRTDAVDTKPATLLGSKGEHTNGTPEIGPPNFKYPNTLTITPTTEKTEKDFWQAASSSSDDPPPAFLNKRRESADVTPTVSSNQTEREPLVRFGSTTLFTPKEDFEEYQAPDDSDLEESRETKYVYAEVDSADYPTEQDMEASLEIIDYPYAVVSKTENTREITPREDFREGFVSAEKTCIY